MRKLFRDAFWRLVLAVIDKPLPPPTHREKELVEELRDKFRHLSTLERASEFPSEIEWLNNMNHLKQLIIEQDPRAFLRWDVMLPMVTGNATYIRPEIAFLKSLPDWKSRWYQVTIESPVGHPTPYWTHQSSSGNLIHHAYHLAQFELQTGINVNQMSSIVEFGGGYGSMCRLWFNLNFQGKYIIFDLPGFQALQEFFLKSIGITVHSVDSFKEAESGVICISDIEQLKLLIKDDIAPDKAMFIGTWSISEAPITLRKTILSLVSEFENFMIAYQAQFNEINNFDYFKTWKEEQKQINWYNTEIEHLPGNYYLFGSRNT